MQKEIFWGCCLVAVVTVLFLAAFRAMGGENPKQEPSNLKAHVPQFAWKTNAAGEKWIYDGDMQVGGLAESPYHSYLRDLRLVPGGQPVFKDTFYITWPFGFYFKTKLDLIDVDDKNPQRLKLHSKSHDIGLRDYRHADAKTWESAFEQETWLELTYDPGRGSYVFDVRSRLQVRPGREQAMAKHYPNLFEYQNLLPAGVFDRFPPNGKKRYQWCVYTGEDGKLYKRPHTHHAGPESSVPPFGKDGILAYVVERDCNPVMQMLGDTGVWSCGSLCQWSWDLHFYHRRGNPAEKAYKDYYAAPKEVHYRVYSEPEAVAQQLLAKAELPPIYESPQVRVPAYVIDGMNNFEPSDEYRRPSDKWFWVCDQGCTWDWTNGYKSAGSLAITGQSEWRFEQLGASYPPQPKLEGRYRIRAMVRTEDVKGGIRLAWQFHVPVNGQDGVYDDRPFEYSPLALSGTNDWTAVVLETTETGPAIYATLKLMQVGSGKSWFDDVKVESIR